jgi:hypothetical protein
MSPFEYFHLPNFSSVLLLINECAVISLKESIFNKFTNTKIFYYLQTLLINNLLKITVFWDMTPSSLGDVYWHFGEYTASIFRPKCGGSIFLLNVCTYLPHYLAHIS